MASAPAGFVSVVREFIDVYQLLRRIFARHRSDELSFGELRDLVRDDEQSVLFRLKEGCHALFRSEPGEGTPSMRREALFDLAVGSLFHEAMKFRENFYQRDVYGPRVRALRDASVDDASGLFAEFEKILGVVSVRLEEGVQECEAVLDHTRDQLRVLLVERRGDGLVARFLVENGGAAASVFGVGRDELFDEIHGSAARGFEQAARSYLDSGYFEEAEGALADAIAHGGEAERLAPLGSYARGMAAYLAGDYEQTVHRLNEWLASDPPAEQSTLADTAAAAVSRIGQLVDSESAGEIVQAATALLDRLPSAASPGTA